MALTDADVKNVERTWSVVYRDAAANGSIILKRFLDKYDYYHKFEKFDGVPPDEITSNPTYKYHVRKLMAVLDKTLRNLHNPNGLRAMLNGLARAHKNRNIERLQFEQLQETILDVLSTEFKISKNEKASWTKTLGIIFPMIYEGFEQ